MLAEFSELEGRDPRLFQRLTEAIAYLLRNQFLHVEDRGSSSLLDALTHKSARRLAEGYFEVAGYRLLLREQDGWAGLLPDLDRIGVPRMRVDESLMLLLLRRLWEEGVQGGELQRYANVLTTVNDAYDAYCELVSQGRRTALSVTDFRELLHALQRRAIVRLGSFDEEAQDMELTIRALIAEVAGDAFVEALEGLVQRAEVAEELSASSVLQESVA